MDENDQDIIDVVIPYTPRKYQDMIHRKLKRYNVLVAHRRFGKSTLGLNQLIYSALNNNREFPKPSYAYIGPFYKQVKRNIWDMLKYYLKDIPNVKKLENELSMELPNGAKISLYGADNPDALKGTYLDGCVVDEVAQCPMSLWGEVIRPMLIDFEGWVIFIGTPKGKNHFYTLYSRGLADRDWYCDTFPQSRTHAISAKELVSMKKDMTPSEISQEVECSFNTTGDDTVIPLEWILACRVHPFPNEPEGQRICGIDVARFGKDSCSACIRQGHKIIYHDKWWLQDTVYTTQRVKSLWDNGLFDICNVDGIGIGGGVVDNLRHANVPVFEVNVALASKSAKMKALRDELWWKVRTTIETKQLQIPQDSYGEQLIIELSTPTYTYMGGKIKVEDKKSIRDRAGSSPDEADALCLTYSDYSIFSSKRITQAAIIFYFTLQIFFNLA
jgi:hypothetical protein